MRKRNALVLVLLLIMAIGVTASFALDISDDKVDKTITKTFDKTKMKSNKQLKVGTTLEERVEAGMISQEEAIAIENGEVSYEEVAFAGGKITPQMLEWKVNKGYISREDADKVIAGTADIGEFISKYK